MFDYLKPYIGRNRPPNRFSPVTSAEIADAEARLRLTFPSQLRTFFLEVGCGFLAQGIDDRRRDPSLVNRIASPNDIVSLMLNPEEPDRPAEGFAPGTLPFFDVGESTYLVMRPLASNPNAILWPDGQTPIAPDLDHFLRSTYRHAAFYRDGIL